MRLSIRHTILDWTARGAISDARAALELAGVLPGAREWRSFLDRLLTWSAAVAFAAAAVFFVAYNWNELGRFAKFALVQALVLGSLIGYWRLGPGRLAGKAALLAGSIFLGALLALFGQVYQTGADTWELFANWAALILPWVLVGRFAGLWMLWIALLNIAIVLYFRVFPGFFGLVFHTQHQLWTLFVFNTVALAAWELAAGRIAWLGERWAPRLLAIASGGLITVLMLEAILGSLGLHSRVRSSLGPWVVYPAWLLVAYTVYRRRIPDVFVLAGGCLSLIVVVTTFLAKQLLSGRGDAAGAFLLIALTVIAMAAISGWWLKHVAGEARA
jgi:uncharacterized membrane protein